MLLRWPRYSILNNQGKKAKNNFLFFIPIAISTLSPYFLLYLPTFYFFSLLWIIYFISLLLKPVDLFFIDIKVQWITYHCPPKYFKNCFCEVKDDAKVLVSGGCVISWEANFDYRIFPKQCYIIPISVTRNSGFNFITNSQVIW